MVEMVVATEEAVEAAVVTAVAAAGIVAEVGDMAAGEGEVAVVGMAVEGEEVVVMVVGEEAEMASTATLGARCRQSIGGA